MVDARVLVVAVHTPSSGGASEASSAEALRLRGFDFLYACKCYLAFSPQAAPEFLRLYSLPRCGQGHKCPGPVRERWTP